jgi:N-acyl-L-homoserine lactone synthetase
MTSRRTDVDDERPTDFEPSLAAIDGICAALLARSGPFRFAEIASARDLEASFHLRYQAVVESGWARPEDFERELERDAYDEAAVHVGGWKGEVLVASARLVLPARGLQLPTEAAFELVVDPVGKVVDVGRMVVSSDQRSAFHGAFAGLLASAWTTIRGRGYAHVCGAYTARMIRLTRSMGIGVVPLGPPRPYWGEERFPVQLDTAVSAGFSYEGSLPDPRDVP